MKNKPIPSNRGLSGGFKSLICASLALALLWHPAAFGATTFTTFAGPSGGSGQSDGTGSAASFNGPVAVAADASGNVYVADSVNNTIRKISPGGLVTTLAGTAGGPGSADGLGSAAKFNNPSGVAVDASGTVYVADANNQTIRKITPEGAVTTLAGSAGPPGSTDGTGSAARFYFPHGIAVDAGGNVYVADTINNTIRKIGAGGIVTTLAGTAGVQGSADGTGSAASFNRPSGVAADGSGNVFVADTNNSTIRKITAAGVVTTLAGTAGMLGSIDGTGSAARLNIPNGVAADGSGNVFVADTNSSTIRKITAAGVVTTLAGTAGVSGGTDGTGGAASFYFTYGVAVGASGALFVADGNDTVRKITAAGVVTTLAGVANVQGKTDGTGNAARFSYPNGIAIDASGNICVVDENNALIRKISAAGAVTTLVGTDGVGNTATYFYPYGIAADASGNLYVADTYNKTIRKITPANLVTTLAGTAGVQGSADGTGSAASFNFPYGIAVDGSGNVYVADTNNHVIRKITSGGVVTTLAGTAGAQGSTDGTGSAAGFNFPHGIAADASGNVFVADSYNHAIRKITTGGVVTTLAGTAGAPGSADGTGSAARFYAPIGLAVDASGNLYVVDTNNNTIRKITPAGVVTTLGGTVGASGCTDGTGSAARFSSPGGIAVDASGKIYVSDTNNHKIRIGVSGLADVATIDAPAGAVGIVRQLNTVPKTGTTFSWSLIRTPAGSTATLSSTTLPNPTFTPDVPDLFVFRLVSSSASGSSITTVSLFGTMPPVVSAGPNDDVYQGLEAAQLFGSATLVSPATSIASYAWTCTGAPGALPANVQTNIGTLNSLIAGKNTSATLTFATGSLPEGDYTLQLTATDNLGGHASATTVVRVYTFSEQHLSGLSVTRSPATPLLAAPTSSALTITAASTTTFSGSFADVIGVEYRFSSSLNNGALSVIQNWSTNNSTVIPAGLGAGYYQYYVEARIGTATATSTLPDGQPPEITAYAPDLAVGISESVNTVAISHITAATPGSPATTFTVTSTQTANVPVYYNVTRSLNGGAYTNVANWQWQLVLNSAGGTFSAVVTDNSPGNGIYLYKVQASTISGVTQASTVSQGIVVGPGVTGVSLGTISVAGSTVSFPINATVTGTPTVYYHVARSFNSGAYAVLTGWNWQAGSGTSIAFSDPTASANGIYLYQVEASSSPTGPYTAYVFTPNIVVGTATVTGVSLSAVTVAGTTVSFTANATVTGNPTVYYHVARNINGGAYTTVSGWNWKAGAGTSIAFSDSTATASGIYLYQVEVSSSPTGPYTAYVFTPNLAVGATVTGASIGAITVSGTTISFPINATVTGNPTVYYHVARNFNGGAYTVLNGWNWQAGTGTSIFFSDATATANGIYCYQVEVSPSPLVPYTAYVFTTNVTIGPAVTAVSVGTATASGSTVSFPINVTVNGAISVYYHVAKSINGSAYTVVNGWNWKAGTGTSAAFSDTAATVNGSYNYQVEASNSPTGPYTAYAFKAVAVTGNWQPVAHERHAPRVRVINS